MYLQKVIFELAHAWVNSRFEWTVKWHQVEMTANESVQQSVAREGKVLHMEINKHELVNTTGPEQGNIINIGTTYQR